jgi:serine/threonine-protein kinase/endoribonuclease IRE1
MVFEGRFDGREVAVKRMLIQFFDIASQETKLLRESDDHPNGTYTLAYLNTLLT